MNKQKIDAYFNAFLFGIELCLIKENLLKLGLKDRNYMDLA